VAEVGGSLHNLRGTSIISYSQGLDHLSNNLVEAYNLLCGLSIAKEENIRSISVFGDLMIIIKTMIGKSPHPPPEAYKLKNIITRIKLEAISFVKVSFLHIKRDLNKEEHKWAKRETDLSPGILVKNGIITS
jgi:ribonuclease HI